MAMKSAGRNRSARISTPSFSIDGRKFASTRSMPSVTSMVLAPSWPDTSNTTPGLPMMVAPPIGGSGALRTSATSFSRTLEPLALVTTVRAMSAGSIDWPSDWKTMRWLAVSMKPAPVMAVALRAAASTSSIDRLKRNSWSGRIWICSERMSLPNTATLATPGTASRRWRSVQSAMVRISISDRVCDVSPRTSTVLDEEVSGVMVGGGMLAGSSWAASASRSETTWRSR